MRFSGPILAACFFLTASSGVRAEASSLWKWSYSGAGVTARGTFVTADSPDKSGGYPISGITGTRNGKKITALQPAGTAIPGNEPFKVDNLIFPKSAGAQLTSHGFGFATADGNYANPFYAGFLPDPGFLEFYSMPPSGSSKEVRVVFSATPIASPEPGPCALILIGLTLCRFRNQDPETSLRGRSGPPQPPAPENPLRGRSGP